MTFWKQDNENTGHEHCWHPHYGPIWMVVPDGHILRKCCKCPATRLIHQEHAHERNAA